MTISAGSRLGPYEVLSPLGAGGMGEVWRARDTRLGREVAIKILPANFSADADRLRRFEQEARAASALNHPGILTIHDVGSHGGVHFVVSELLEGETLRQLLAGGALPARKTVEYAVQIAQGLAAAHEKGIVHRDLKPENLFVTKDGRAKILDFGLAKLAAPQVKKGEATEEPTVPLGSDSGVVFGTVGYMSPEQVRGQPADHRSDIFSFGAVLYEMLAGRRAFRRDSGVETMAAILKEEPPEISGTGRAVPPALERIVRRCLEKSAGERFQSARDIAFALEEASSVSMPFVAGAPGSPSPPRRMRRLVWLAAGALLLVLGLVAVDAGGIRSRIFRVGGAARIQSIAVLPLENLSGSQEQDFFADGMTEALIADLARIRALHVISRTSVMRYKGARRSLPEIARELGVDAVVEGSVMRSGNRVRITAQLIHAASDRHLWTENYERELRDVLDLQREVARAIVTEIEVQLTPAERADLQKSRRVDPAAYEAYLKGRYHWNKRSPDAIQTGIAHFEEAIERDPSYALAYAGLADSYSVLGSYGFSSPVDVMPRAKAAASRALEMDQGLAEAHASLAFAIHRYDRDYRSAEREFRRAIELNPSYATAHHWYALLLAALGRRDEAIAEIEKARTLDPLSLIINTNVGWVSYSARAYDRAIAQYRKALEMDPQFRVAVWKLRQAYEVTRRYPEAFAELEKSVELWGLKDLAVEFRRIYERSGYLAVLRRWVQTYEEAAKSGYVNSYDVARLYANLGENDRAFAWLARACEERSVEVGFVAVEPAFDALRPDARYEALLRCLGLRPAT